MHTASVALVAHNFLWFVSVAESIAHTSPFAHSNFHPKKLPIIFNVLGTAKNCELWSHGTQFVFAASPLLCTKRESKINSSSICFYFILCCCLEMSSAHTRTHTHIHATHTLCACPHHTNSHPKLTSSLDIFAFNRWWLEIVFDSNCKIIYDFFFVFRLLLLIFLGVVSIVWFFHRAHTTQ